MHLSIPASAIAAAALVMAPANLQTLRYEPSNARHEITQSVTINMLGMGSEEIKVFARVGLNITADKGDTLTVAVDVDSAATTSSGNTTQLLPRGARTIVRPLSSGRRGAPVADSDVLGTLVSELFFELPRDARVGAVEVDTIVEVDEDMKEIGINAITMIVNSRIAADTTVDGEGAWKIDFVGNLVPITKDSTMAMGSMKMNVKGDVAGSAIVSKRGALIGMKRSDKVTVLMDMTIMGNSQSLTMEQGSTLESKRIK